MEVEIEEQNSWPENFLAAAKGNLTMLLDYHQREAEIRRIQREDVLARIKPPKNENREAYEQLADDLEDMLRPHSLVAYHCTRLTSQEIASVRASGLRLLSSALVSDRLLACVQAGHLEKADYQPLVGHEVIAANLADHQGSRDGKIWFCPNRSTLQDPSAVYRLFRSWGGEAVYRALEENPNVAKTLRSVGQPCIVKCAIPFHQARPSYPGFAKRFLSEFVSNEIVSPEPQKAFDLYTENDVSSDAVRAIIEHRSPQFEQLTRESCWPERYSINTDS